MKSYVTIAVERLLLTGWRGGEKAFWKARCSTFALKGRWDPDCKLRVDKGGSQKNPQNKQTEKPTHLGQVRSMGYGQDSCLFAKCI